MEKEEILNLLEDLFARLIDNIFNRLTVAFTQEEAQEAIKHSVKDAVDTTYTDLVNYFGRAKGV